MSLVNVRFDLYSFDIPNRPEDEEGLFAAVKQINNLINAEIEAGIPPHRIIVGGLSQGAALSILTGLTAERKLGGIFVLSGYVPLRAKAKSVRSLASIFLSVDVATAAFLQPCFNCTICVQICTPLLPSIPLFFTHGTADQQVNYKFALEAAETFAEQLKIPFHFSESSFPPGVQEGDLAGLRFHSYEDMGHEILETELEDLRLWIAAILSKQETKTAVELN